MIKKSTYITFLFLTVWISNIQSAINYCPFFPDKDSLNYFAIAEFDTAKQYELQEILIKETSPLEKTNYSISIQKFKIAEILSFNSISLGDALKLSSGIFVKSYGAEGSLQTVSVRGAGSEYSSVSLNGMDLSNSLSGNFDFSNYTTDELSAIALNLGSDFNLSNSNSFNGSITLIPFRKNDSTHLKLKYTLGSFGLNLYSAGFNQEFPNSKFSLDYQRRTSENSFPYQFDGITFHRSNADLDQSIITSTLFNDLKISDNYFLIKSLARYSDKELGLPGFIASNKHAKNNVRQLEKSGIFVTNLEWFFVNGLTLNSVIGLSSSSINISDPQAEINLRSTNFNSSNKNLNMQFGVHYFGKDYSFSAGINSTVANFSFGDDGIYSQQNTSLKRFSHNFSAALSRQISLSEDSHKLGVNILLNSLFVKSKQSDESNSTSYQNYKIGLGYFPFAEDFLRLFANYSFGVRIPNFYEEYYSKLNFLSSSNLKNEIIYDFEMGINLNSSLLTTDLIFYNRIIKDKIVWYTNRIAIFSPRNAGRVISNGFEARLMNIYFKEFFSAQINYTFTNVYNAEKLGGSDRTYGKQLIYIPKHTANVILNFYFGHFSSEFILSYFSQRFYSEDNDPMYVLPQGLLLNFALSCRIPITAISAAIQLSVNNITNQNYFLIQSYPMPGRNYKLSIKTEI
jgi:hypothetical protein